MCMMLESRAGSWELSGGNVVVGWVNSAVAGVGGYDQVTARVVMVVVVLGWSALCCAAGKVSSGQSNVGKPQAATLHEGRSDRIE